MAQQAPIKSFKQLKEIMTHQAGARMIRFRTGLSEATIGIEGSGDQAEVRVLLREIVIEQPTSPFKSRRRGVNRGSSSPSKKQWCEVLRHDVCCYCGVKGNGTVEHLTPNSRGGRNTYDNLAGACFSCNNDRKSKDLLQFLLQQKPVDSTGS